MSFPKFQRTAVTDAGDVIAGATITVRDQVTGVIVDPIYSDEGTTTKNNPFTTGNDGFIEFFAPNGVYRVEAVGGSGSIEWTNVQLGGTAAVLDAQTSATDATADRVLKVGAFGLGGDKPVLSDLDNATDGFAVCASSASNLPPGVTFTGGVSVYTYLADNFTPNAYQRAVGRQSGNNKLRIFERQRITTVWQPWREVYHAGSILGTVSESGGVPTGAVIERGSNANGEYVKFADGALIATSVVTASLTSTAIQTFPFPASIIAGVDSPYLSFSMAGIGGERAQYRLTDGFLVTSLSDSWSVQLTATGGATGTCTLRMLAIGRWF